MNVQTHKAAPASGFMLEVRPGTPEQPVLGVFDLDGSGPEHWDLGLHWLGGDFRREAWSGQGPVHEYTHGGCLLRLGSGLAMFAISLPDDGRADPAPLVEYAYRQILDALQDAGGMAMARLWNYLPYINRGDGDRERYRRFCVGRGAALAASGVDNESLCAGTAIGTRDGYLRVYGLAASAPGLHIENPRQVSAYRYPSEYGPHSPSFARATALPRPDGSMALLVSGTASVVGHETMHPGDLDAQLAQMVRNLRVLLATSARRLHRQALADFDAGSLLRVYLRNPRAWHQVEEYLRGAWPRTRIAALGGDICRRDLEVEIEAWHCG